MNEVTIALVLLAAVAVIAIWLIFPSSEERVLKEHQFCSYCGKQMQPYAVQRNGKIATYLICVVAIYEKSASEERKHDTLFVFDKRVANYDTKTGRAK